MAIGGGKILLEGIFWFERLRAVYGMMYAMNVQSERHPSKRGSLQRRFLVVTYTVGNTESKSALLYLPLQIADRPVASIGRM